MIRLFATKRRANALIRCSAETGQGRKPHPLLIRSAEGVFPGGAFRLRSVDTHPTTARQTPAVRAPPRRSEISGPARRFFAAGPNRLLLVGPALKSLLPLRKWRVQMLLKYDAPNVPAQLIADQDLDHIAS